MIIIYLTVIALVGYCIYQWFFSRLSWIPGPKIAALSSAWILYITWSEQRNRVVDELHRRYGPIIRLSPNEISISDQRYIKVIYSSGNFDKTDFYKQFSNYDEINTFSSLTRASHRNRRKVLSQMYSKSSIMSDNMEQLVQNKVSTLIRHIESTEQKETDIYEPFHCLAMDVITAFIFGEKRGSNLLETRNYKVIQDYRSQSAMWFWTTLMPRWWNWAADKKTQIASKAASEWNLNNCKRADKGGLVFDRLAHDNVDSIVHEKEPVFDRLTKHGIVCSSTCEKRPDLDHLAEKNDIGPIDHEKKPVLNQLSKHDTVGSTVYERGPVLNQLAKHGIVGLSAYSEIQDHVAAGHETTGATLAFLVWQLSIREDVQEALHAEIQSAKVEFDTDRLSYKIIDKLKYLDAIVCETLRLYAAIPGAEPRLTPQNGMPFKLNGKNHIIPGNIIVSIQPWTLHRDENVYENPLEFRPERWLKGDSKLLQNFIPFGSGARMCIGMNLALMEIKLTIVSIYSEYHTVAGPNMDPNLMGIVDKYTVHPKGHTCLLEFRKIVH